MSVNSPLTPALVQSVLSNAANAANTDQAIIAVVDRTGNILGVREEQGVLNNFASQFTPGTPAYEQLNVYAIDGAVAEARTAAFFSNDTAALTSRTVRFISQSTITQREVQSNPDIPNVNSTLYGPGLVAPIGLGGHFPPGVLPTDSADLFEIELSNRDKSAPGVERFNINPSYVPAGQSIYSPNSYGVQSGLLTTAQSRGIGTLPGGVPLYYNGELVGGVGVFFPGTTGDASYEQNFQPLGNKPDNATTQFARTNSQLELVAEGMALYGAGLVSDVANKITIPSKDVQPINLGGIRLESVGPYDLQLGKPIVLQALASLGKVTHPPAAVDQPVDPANHLYLQGTEMPQGWLVTPHASPDGSSTLTAQNVQTIIMQGVTTANQTRAQIRLPYGSSAKMTIAVTDNDGNVLGLYRMPDATVFSIDVAVAKARNTAYYDNPAEVQPVDLLPGYKAGVALNNQTFRYLALPNYPTGSAGSPGYFSPLNDVGINPKNGENLNGALSGSVYVNSANVVDHDAFVAASNFHETNNLANQNGIVFFPGSTPLYVSGHIAGGLGVSGDGVDQDNVVTYYAAFYAATQGQENFGVPSTVARADQTFFRGVRLPFFVFSRNSFNL